MLSYDYWRTHFGAAPSVVGQTLRINGHPFQIVGVAPEDFHTAIGGYLPELFIPVTMVDEAMPWAAPGHRLDNHLNIWLTVIARLKPGVSLAAGAGQHDARSGMRSAPQEVTLYPYASRKFKDGMPR